MIYVKFQGLLHILGIDPGPTIDAVTVMLLWKTGKSTPGPGKRTQLGLR